MDHPSLPVRKRQRLAGFDYGGGYAYFITICLRHRLPLLGQVAGGIFLPTPAGVMVGQVWDQLPSDLPGVVLDVVAIMPDHFHAVLGIISPNVALNVPVGGPAQRGAPAALDA